MRVFDLATALPVEAREAVTIIGNFDAVHLGHVALIREAGRLAKEKNIPLAVLTFEPHPRRLFRPDDAPFRVTPAALKLERLDSAGVDMVYVCPFDWTLAALSPDEFIQSILIQQINPAAIVIGQDFHFGQHRTGNANTLRQAGFAVTEVPLLGDGHYATISATRIRGAIQSGHMDEANRLLGWDWEIRGVVEHGNKRGRTIGYPTANVALGETIHPSYGVYASLVRIAGEEIWRPAATNIGIRPMFEVKTGLVESYLFDFTGDLYGQVVHIRPVQKIRDEAKFDSLEALIAGIEADCRQIRALLKAD